MLSDQVTAQIRQLLTAIGTIAGVFGLISPDLTESYVSIAMATLGPAMVIYSSGWSIYANLKSSLIRAVDAIPEVRGVVTTKDEAGRALADSIPGQTVAPAGTPAAAKLSRA
jgi:hypothetical protein